MSRQYLGLSVDSSVIKEKRIKVFLVDSATR